MTEGRHVLLAAAAWAFGHGASPLLRWTQEQTRDLVEKLCGACPRLVGRLVEPFTVVVGTPESNRFVQQAVAMGLIELSRLGRDDYLIKESRLDGSPVLLIVGGNERAATYGVFDLLEQLGCSFLISGDVVPESDPALALPRLDVVRHTANAWRGLWFQYCFATNSMMSIPDYARMFDQMAKMRLNHITYYHFENEPFIDFTYRGERKLVGDISHPSSGYISYGRRFAGSYLVQDVAIGRERFGRKKVAPLEFQEVESPAEALDVGTAFQRELIQMARTRGIASWIAFLPQFVPLNLLKYTRRMPRVHAHWSGLVSACDPSVDEINRARIAAIAASNPGLEGVFLGIPEGYYPDPYPDSGALVEKEMPCYAEALALHKRYWGEFWPDDALLEAHIRQDIGFVEILQRTLSIAREVAPQLQVGVMTVCKAYLLTRLHEILPKDVPFADIESRSLWTLDGAPLHLFRRMKGRSCAIIPRAVDDGSLAGLQYDLNLYHLDRFCASARENGTAGLIIQTTHVRGNEHNLKFLSDGMWDETLTPERFYQRYARALFGSEAASAALRAYQVLEENEQALGGRGMGNMPWNKVPREIEMLRPLKTFGAPFYEAPFSEESVRACGERADHFRQTVERLRSAQALFEQALEMCTTPGRGELRYAIRRTKGYLHHLKTLICLAETYKQHWQGFSVLERGGLEAFKDALQRTLELARGAETEAGRAAAGFAACVEHPTDLGVLWMINSSMVTGTRVYRQYLDNIVAYYAGQPYWNKVDWDLLFGENPFPLYGLDRAQSAIVAADKEPG